MAVRDPEPPPILKKRGEYEPDSDLRDAENVRLPADRVSYEQDPSHRQAGAAYRSAVEDHVEREVHPTSRTPGSTTPRPRSATKSR